MKALTSTALAIVAASLCASAWADPSGTVAASPKPRAQPEATICPVRAVEIPMARIFANPANPYPSEAGENPDDVAGVAGCEGLAQGEHGSPMAQCRMRWAGIPAAHPLPRLINVERARDQLAALPPVKPEQPK